ncbi:hypothetical protein R5R35_000867 [Gryllus longicercus]|uniref:Uncharacterized protein n=1 Tax=Gryllus longicercus TaxID=2509291 RepID=A0AAN9VS77_9ORTH
MGPLEERHFPAASAARGAQEAEPTEALLAAFGERQPPVRRHSAIGLVRHDAPPPALSRRGASDLAPSVSLPDLRVLGELRAALAPPPPRPRPAHADADVESVERI